MSVIGRLTWRHLFLYSLALRTPVDRREKDQYQFFYLFLVQGSVLGFPFEQHTVPAWVTLRFLKPSRHVSKGNALENVHVSTEPEADVISLHHATLGVHNPKLEILHKGLCEILELVSFSQFVYTIMLRCSIKLKTPLVFSLIITEKCTNNRINVQLYICLISNPVY